MFTLEDALKQKPASRLVTFIITDGPTERELKNEQFLPFTIGMGLCIFFDPSSNYGVTSFSSLTLEKISIDKSQLTACCLQKYGHVTLSGRDCITSELFFRPNGSDESYCLTEDADVTLFYNSIRKEGYLTLKH